MSYETAAGQSGDESACRVCNKLRQPLSNLAGVTGFRALLSRALVLAKEEAPALDGVQVALDGSLEFPDGKSAAGPERDGEAGTLIVARLLGLLVIFIGEALTLRLVEEMWPELREGRAEQRKL